MTIPDGLEPVAVWDGPERAHLTFTDGELDQVAWWLQKHLTEHARDAYRIDFHRIDIGDRTAHIAIVHRYARNADGYKHNDPATGKIAIEEPVIVPLDELPPEHLLRPA